MDRARVFKWLRATASAGCLAVCGLLAALWIRSYSWNESFARSHGHQCVTTVGSQYGGAYFVRYDFSDHIVPVRQTMGWEYHRAKAFRPQQRFQVAVSSEIVLVQVPYWLFVLVPAIGGTLAAAAWLPWSPRFSLQTLMIFTTLVALGLGLAVYVVKR